MFNKQERKMKQNTVSHGTVNIRVGREQLPFGNTFVQLKSQIITWEGRREIVARVLCTEGSKEPGRIYDCAYSMDGTLVECDTVN
jgi:hypothetical protein